MFKVDDIPDQVLRDIAGAYHRRLTSTDTESQPVDERDFQRTCYLRTALEWLALWLKQQPAPGIDDVIEKIVEYGGHRENEGGSYATFQKSEARRYRAEADEVLEEVRAMLAAPAAQAASPEGPCRHPDKGIEADMNSAVAIARRFQFTEPAAQVINDPQHYCASCRYVGFTTSELEAHGGTCPTCNDGDHIFDFTPWPPHVLPAADEVCPVCNGKFPMEEFNILAMVHEPCGTLIKEWRDDPEQKCVVCGAQPAAQAVADDVVRHIAAIAHDGGLRGIDPFDALDMIRRLTLGMWDKSGTIDDLRNRVDAALLAAQQQEDAP